MDDTLEWAIGHLIDLATSNRPQSEEEWHDHCNYLTAIATRLELSRRPKH